MAQQSEPPTFISTAPSPSLDGRAIKRQRLSLDDSTASTPRSTTSIVSSHPPPLAPSPTSLPRAAPPTTGKAGGIGSQSANFRNVSACNRCRLRKNRCDQRLPNCASCEKAGTKCVGYDPITKCEIPRSYVFYLESRVSHLESLLLHNGIPFASPDVLDAGARVRRSTGGGSQADIGVETESKTHSPVTVEVNSLNVRHPSRQDAPAGRDEVRNESERLSKLISNIGMVPVQGATDPRYLGSTSGISFARVVFAAVKSSVSGANSDKGGVRPSKPATLKGIGTGSTSMRDNFFGLQTKPTIRLASFPDRELGLRLVEIYFEYSNPQIPVLHRGEFMKMFEHIYSDSSRTRTPRESYMLNIVYAIGSGVFLGEADVRKSSAGVDEARSPPQGQAASSQCQPEEYHASAIVHLEACLSVSSLSDKPDGFGGGLEELQAVLLLAGFALLRPVAPGLWYIVGVAVRLAVDLGLHYEDGKDIEVGLEDTSVCDSKSEGSNGDKSRRESSAKEKGRRQWVRDLRRRLWWCTYSFDRLVSTCVGRPFGISDQAITTEFPSMLDDKYITKEGFLELENGMDVPSYKHVSYHYFRLRLLQSEILQVLQFQQAQILRAGGANRRNPFMHTHLSSPFLAKFDSFRSWRSDIDRRLWEWKSSAPAQSMTGVRFSPDFLELNYWQAIIMLYRQSLSVPAVFESEFSTSAEVESPSSHTVELREDVERVCLKVAEAGQRTLRLYRSLHRLKLVNYTFLATHHLFMAGISFLYAIWHSSVVRSRLTMDEVDFTILAATSVLGDMVEKCPPAEACRDAFNRMSKATVQMCMSTTGFSSHAQPLSAPHHRANINDIDDTSAKKSAATNPRDRNTTKPASAIRNQQHSVKQLPQFDMGLNDLFPPPSPQPIANGHILPLPLTISSSKRIKNEYPLKDDRLLPLPADMSPRNVPQSTMIDPSLLPGHDYSNKNPGQLYQHTPEVPLNNFNHQQDFTYRAEAAPQQMLDFSNMNIDMDFTSMDAYGGEQGQAGLDVGFGLGWEGMDHDFSEGGGLDLFDGFFFGGSV